MNSARILSAVALVASPLVGVACATLAGIDEPTSRLSDDGGEGDVATGADAGAIAARSCSDVMATGARTDGDYTIDIDGTGPSPAFTVYCRNMATVEPTEYLELPANADAGLPGSNFSGVATGGLCPCPATTLSFTRVRLLLSPIGILTADRTFGELEGDASCAVANDAYCIVSQMTYAFAGSCAGGGDLSGQGDVDLHGTPFHISPSAMFHAVGYLAAASAQVSSDMKTAALQGGGYSGFCTGASDAGVLPVEFDLGRQ
jgi:hypothetical protein